jgi:hypothetical protein
MVLFSSQTSTAFNFSGSDNINEALLSFSERATLMCDGQSVGSLAVHDGIMCRAFDCTSASTLELCLTPSISHPSTASFTGTRTTEFCGAVVCIRDLANDQLQGYFNPGYSPGCCYGREFVHLLTQNVSALTTTLSEFGQLPACRSVRFEDDEDHVIVNNAQTVTEFLALGYVEVCGRMRSARQSAIMQATPRISCGGQELDCNTRTVALIPPDEGEPEGELTCLRVPVVVCGQCQPGDDLIIGLRSLTECNEQPAVVTSPGSVIESNTQQYCVYTFERIQNDFGDAVNGNMGQCLPLSTFQRVADVMTSMKSVSDNQSQVGLTTRTSAATVTAPDPILIQEALVPQPPDFDTGPKKWFVTLSMTASGPRAIPIPDSFNGPVTAIATADITCGGAVVETVEARWEYGRSGAYTRTGVSEFMAACIECPTDQPIELVLTAETRQFGAPGFIAPPDTFSYDLKMFCF